MKTQPTIAELQPALREVYAPQEPIETEPAELDEAKHETEAGGLFAVALFALAVVGAPFLVWLIHTVAR